MANNGDIIDHDQPDVLQKFATLIRLTRCYHWEPTGSDSSAERTPKAPDSAHVGAKVFESETEKRKDDGVLMDVNNPPKKRMMFPGEPSDEVIQFDENGPRQDVTTNTLSGLMRSDVSAEIAEGSDEGQVESAGEATPSGPNWIPLAGCVLSLPLEEELNFEQPIVPWPLEEELDFEQPIVPLEEEDAFCTLKSTEAEIEQLIESGTAPVEKEDAQIG